MSQSLVRIWLAKSHDVIHVLNLLMDFLTPALARSKHQIKVDWEIAMLNLKTAREKRANLYNRGSETLTPISRKTG